MKFIKYYLPVMLKLLGNQIIVSLLSIMLFGVLKGIPVPFVETLGNILALGVYFYMQGRVLWEHACKETFKHKDAQMHIGRSTGLVLGLCTSIPSILLNLIPVISPMYISDIGNLTGSSYPFYTISKLFFNGQYQAIFDSFFPTQQLTEANEVIAAQNGTMILSSIPYYLLTFIPLTLVCWFSYWLGLKDKTLLSWLGIDHLFKTKQKNKTQERPNMKK